MKKPKILTGITPTGDLTIGHYCGVIDFLVKQQNEYEIIIMIADIHALTTINKDINYKNKSYELASWIYACGLEPNNCKIFLQSEIPQHSELTLLFSPFVNISKLKNMIQFKEKNKNNKNSNLLLFSYPVLMASDIFLYDPEFVILGEDQRQHSEIIKKIGTRFNEFKSKNIIKNPKFIFSELGNKIFSLNDPSKKMSKSEKTSLFLSDKEEKIEKKIRKAN